MEPTMTAPTTPAGRAFVDTYTYPHSANRPSLEARVAAIEQQAAAAWLQAQYESPEWAGYAERAVIARLLAILAEPSEQAAEAADCEAAGDEVRVAEVPNLPPDSAAADPLECGRCGYFAAFPANTIEQHDDFWSKDSNGFPHAYAAAKEAGG